MADGDERWLRPNARVLLRLWPLSVGRLGLILAVWYVLMWWWQGGLDFPVAAYFGGTLAAYGGMLGTFFALSWLATRRVAWRVGPEGVAVYHHNQLRRSFGWAEVDSLQVWRVAVVARLATAPFKERLQWPQKEGVAWLRAYARERLGDRIG